jgi:hypothetical protein
MMRAKIAPPFLALLALCPFFAACAGQSAGSAPAFALVMDGPPLAIVGEYSGLALTGNMDRTCMAGYGSLALKAADPGREFACTAEMDDPPTEKGRVRGLLRCADGRRMLFSLRNTGPDQGVGIGRDAKDSDLLVLFYHSSAEEAGRRFPAVKEDLERARARQ